MAVTKDRMTKKQAAKAKKQVVVQIGRARPTDHIMNIRVSKKTEDALKRMADGNGVLQITERDFKTAIENYFKPEAEAVGNANPIRIEPVAQPEDTRSILEIAHEIIYGDREQAYGNPRFNLDTIAMFWSVYFRRKFPGMVDEQFFTAEDVAQMMILLKTSRLIHNPGHKDSLVDQAGYAGLQGRIQDL